MYDGVRIRDVGRSIEGKNFGQPLFRDLICNLVDPKASSR